MKLFDYFDPAPLSLPQFDVLEPEGHGPINTGLLDANGQKIYRARQPVGFDLSGRKQ